MFMRYDRPSITGSRTRLRAGRARELVSLSQAAQFLRLTGRRVPEEAARVVVEGEGSVDEAALKRGRDVNNRMRNFEKLARKSKP